MIFPARETLRPLAILAVTALAMAIGGSESRVCSLALLAAIGLCALVFPLRQRISPWILVICVLIAGLVLAAYLPHTLFPGPKWRQAATEDLGLTLGDRLTPQPWVTLEKGALLAGALIWFSYLSSQVRSERIFSALAHGLVACLTALLVLNLGLRLSHRPWPWGEHEAQFSPFPNQNQLATLAAMNAAILAGALACAWRSGNRLKLAAAGIALVISLTALVCIGSRAALILTAAAFLLIALCGRWGSRARPRAAAIALSLVLLGGTALSLSGTRLAERLAAPSGTALTDLQSGRLAIYADTFALIREGPLFGQGLGNFAAVFPFFRERSASDLHIRHPESDWLWWWAELGWAVPILVAAGLVILILKRPWRRPVHRQESLENHGLRLGLGAALFVFVMHSLVDVPAHRIGSLFPFLLVLSLLISPRRHPLITRSIPSRIAPAIATFLALGLVIAGPQDLASRAPLDWRGHFIRARDILAAGGSPGDALTEFQRARFLEPHAVSLPRIESQYWLNHEPSFAIEPWREMLLRDPDHAADHYQHFLNVTRREQDLSWRGIRELAGGDPELWLLFLRHAPDADATQALEAIAERTDLLAKFDPPQRHQLSELWARRGNLHAFERWLEGKPDWMQAAAPTRARLFAEAKRYQDACEVWLPYLAAPAAESSLGALRRAYWEEPGNATRLVKLLEASLTHGQFNEAEHLLQSLPPTMPPDQLNRWRFLLACGQDQWELAWQCVKPHGLSWIGLSRTSR